MSVPLTHGVLVARAIRWLRGTMRCRPVLSGIASAGEIPDAIGWSSKWNRSGSILVECKVSIPDFLRDKRKGVKYYMNEKEKADAISQRIGRCRYFLVPEGLVDAAYCEKHYADHGLLYYDGRRVSVVREAPARDNADVWSEVRLLRFALIHLEENLLRKGCTVDLCQLTKHWAVERNGIRFPEKTEGLRA